MTFTARYLYIYIYFFALFFSCSSSFLRFERVGNWATGRYQALVVIRQVTTKHNVPEIYETEVDVSECTKDPDDEVEHVCAVGRQKQGQMQSACLEAARICSVLRLFDEKPGLYVRDRDACVL